MPIEILMPALSPTMEEGTLAKWLVKEGDAVASGDLLAEIETDKATMEFEAVDEGIIGKLLVAEGTENVAVNSAIAVLLEDDGESSSEVDAAPSAPASPAPAAEAATSSPAKSATLASSPASTPPAAEDKAAEGARIFATPLARKLAAQNNVDLTRLSGSGPRGRIVKADIEAAGSAVSADRTVASMASAASTSGAASAPQSANFETISKLYAERAYEEISLDRMRKTIAARLTEAKQTVPHFYLRRDVMLDNLLGFRGEMNAALAERDVKLSVNDFVIKACALALTTVPTANAIWAGDRILQFTPADIAVAVAIDGGLITPVLKDADQKSLSVLSTEMKDLATRAKGRKLAPDEYQGGSFAISNLGMFGIDNFDAVINPPHGAILAVGAGKKKPVVTASGELGVATVMSLTLSVDHRVIDGALGAELLNVIVKNLENPMAMLA